MRKPEEITSYEFKKGRGYKAEEVDDYLRSVSTDYRKLYLENQSLKEKLLLVTRELQDYKDGASALERTFSPQPERAEAGTLPEQSFVEESQRENLKIRSQLKDTKEQLSQKFEAFRNQYISFMESQLNTIKSDAFSFSVNAELEGLLEKEESTPVEKESVRNHKKSDDLFQMLDHMNQQMKEESDARMLQKIADEVASAQKESASVTEEEAKEANDITEQEKAPEKEERKEALREPRTKSKEEKPRKSEGRTPGETGKKAQAASTVKKEGRKIPVVKNSSIRTGAAEKKASQKDSGSTSAAKKPKASEFHGEKTLIEKLAEEVEASEAMGQTIVFQPVKTEEASDMDKTIVFQPVHSEKGEA